MNGTCPHCLREVRFDVQAVCQIVSGESHQIQQCQACGGVVYRLAEGVRDARVMWGLGAASDRGR
jgi:hypothetical protein